MAVSTGIAAYGSAQKTKAAKSQAKGQAAASAAQLQFMETQAAERAGALRKLLKGGNFEFPSVDVGKATDEALSITTRNLPGIIANTRSVYDAATQNFRDYLRSTFGKTSTGQDALPLMEQAASGNVLSQLAGDVAPGTRSLLGRRALATGAPSLGKRAVENAYTYALGMTSEEQAQKGLQNYGSLYEQYGRFAPNITPMDLLPYGGLQTGQSIQNAQFNASGEFQANVAEANAILGNIDQETSTLGPLIGPQVLSTYGEGIASALGRADMATEIGSGIQGMMGSIYAQGLMNNMYGTQVPTAGLSSAEAAYNKKNNIFDYTGGGGGISNYYLRGGGYEGASPAALFGLGMSGGRGGYGMSGGFGNEWAGRALYGR